MFALFSHHLFPPTSIPIKPVERVEQKPKSPWKKKKKGPQPRRPLLRRFVTITRDRKKVISTMSSVSPHPMENRRGVSIDTLMKKKRANSNTVHTPIYKSQYKLTRSFFLLFSDSIALFTLSNSLSISLAISLGLSSIHHPIRCWWYMGKLGGNGRPTPFLPFLQSITQCCLCLFKCTMPSTDPLIHNQQVKAQPRQEANDLRSGRKKKRKRPVCL